MYYGWITGQGFNVSPLESNPVFDKIANYSPVVYAGLWLDNWTYTNTGHSYTGQEIQSAYKANIVAAGPTFEISRSRYPNHTRMLDNAVKNGHSLNNLEKVSRTDAKANRNRATGPYKSKYYKANGKNIEPGYDWDEFPYASTKQGGSGAYAEQVPSSENQAVGRDLGQFYQANGIQPGDTFDIVIIP